MKELSIEEKAKAYDKVVNKLKGFIAQGVDPLITRADVQDFFPELRESEGEMIRKALIRGIESVCNKEEVFIEGFTRKQIVAWLEKQGEHCSLNSNKECLKGIKRVQEYKDLSDWEKEFDSIASMYAHNKNQEGYNNSWYVKERAAEMLHHAKKELEKQGEQKPAWSEEDDKMYNSLTEFEKAVKQVMEEAIECGDTHNLKADADMLLRLTQKPAWSEEDIMRIDNIIAIIEGKGYPDYVSWLESLKDKVQPKSEWSKEDDYYYGIIQYILNDECVGKTDKENAINWLKSLSPQNHWKPSDEQMDALEAAISSLQSTSLETLYKQLKQL